MPPDNGHSSSERLDRIERSLETLVGITASNATAIADLQQGHRNLIAVTGEIQQEQKHLLTAQVVLTDRIDKLTQRVEELTVDVASLAGDMRILMNVFDGIIRDKPRQ